jgi:hypothetical protein
MTQILAPGGLATAPSPHFNDRWEVNGCADLGFLDTKNLSGDYPAEHMPIRLARGFHDHGRNAGWGEVHIMARHGRWVTRVARQLRKEPLSVAELAWLKLQQTGTIYEAEKASKTKLALSVGHGALMVLQYVSVGFFSITTLYAMPSQIDGRSVGRYVGRKHRAERPLCELVSSQTDGRHVF